MSWYDFFSGFYDRSLEDLYRPHRETAAAALGLAAGQRVLDAGCGTGQSLEVLVPGVGDTGRVVGVDLSQGMLKKARARAERKGWGGQVTLTQASLLTLTRADVAEGLGDAPGFDRALFFLALTTLERWREAFEHVWALVAPGGRVVVVDTHAAKPGMQGKMVNWMAGADIRREVWRGLEEVGRDVEVVRHKVDWRIGGDLVVASGTKPRV
jgi:ubiquinone/menaquinone biosynthesis C-methylase UbiE